MSEISKSLPGKTPNGECIWVHTHILQWKLKNDSALCESICIMVAFGRRICTIYQEYVWIYYSRLKWLVYFVNLELLIYWTYDGIKKMIILIVLNLYGWGSFNVYIVNVILYFGIWLCYWPRISNLFGCKTPYRATWKCSPLYFIKFLDADIVFEGP